MRLQATIDASTLPPEDARALQEMVNAAGFFELPAMITGSAAGADRFQYTVTVEAAGRRHTVRTSDAAAPASLRPLLEWLTQTARRARSSGSTP